MMLSDKRVKECEFQLKMAKDLMDQWINEVAALRMRVRQLEENQLITQDIQMQSPLGAKFFFTFTMPDGTPNGGFCNEAGSLPRIVEIVKCMGGTELVIKDETIYLNVTKTSI